MKKFIVNFYIGLVIILFIIVNIILADVKITGLLYIITMDLFLIFNTTILLLFRNEIKFKGILIIISFLIFIFSKDIYQFIFIISTMVILIVSGISTSKFIQIIVIIINVFILIFHIPILFFIIILTLNEIEPTNTPHNIYEEDYYYCKNNYEAYIYSAGAMDGYHYNIGKHYEILSTNGIITISYHKKNEISKDQYYNFIENNKCILAGDKNGSK